MKKSWTLFQLDHFLSNTKNLLDSFSHSKTYIFWDKNTQIFIGSKEYFYFL